MSVGFKLFGSESIYFDTSRQSSLDTSFQLNPFSSFFFFWCPKELWGQGRSNRVYSNQCDISRTRAAASGLIKRPPCVTTGWQQSSVSPWMRSSLPSPNQAQPSLTSYENRYIQDDKPLCLRSAGRTEKRKRKLKRIFIPFLPMNTHHSILHHLLGISTIFPPSPW